MSSLKGKSPSPTARDHIAAGDLHFSRGEYQRAFDRFGLAAGLEPMIADHHFRIASAAWQLNLKTKVELHYLQAIRLDPGFAEAHKKLAQWFASQRQNERALEYSAKALELAPADADIRITRAVVLTAAGEIDQAWEILKPLVEAGQPNWHLATAYSDIAAKIGHHEQAVAMIERTLAEVKVPAVLARRLRVSAASLLEAIGRFDDAFTQMRRAKELLGDTFDPANYSRWVTQTLDYFTPARVRALPRATHGNTRPVLIVGMPRSGTSLIEQILASHPAIFGGGELAALGQIGAAISTLPWANATAYPHNLDLLCLREADRLASAYLGAIEAINSSATYVTDKMPQNFEWLGLAQILLPDCRVIHCVRDPRDTCLSCFLTDFDRGLAFSRRLDHLVSYYRDYQRQMAHWKTVLEMPLLQVRYEEVVSDPAGQARRMLEFLNLPWDDRCLAFHENKREVATASREQVRQPLYTSSVGRWKRYEKSIPELLELKPDVL